MPSYAIHLAVAEEYLRKNKNLTENHDAFIKGVVYPDTVKDKSITHYGKCSSQSNLYRFLEENSMNTSFERGCFLHLLTDYLFYNQYIDTWSEDIYNDYDILNQNLVENYHLTIPKEAQDIVIPEKKNQLVILSETLVNEFIEDVSDMNIDDVVAEVKDSPEKWTKTRPLKII